MPWRWDRRARPGSVPLLRDSWELRPAGDFPLRLSGLLAAARPGTTLMLDLKGIGGVGPAVLKHLHERVPVPLMVCARWWPSVDAFRDQAWVQPVLSARGRTELVRLRRRLVRGPLPHGVSVHRSLLDVDVVRALRRRVELVMTWPVDDERALEQVLALGVTGVITDDAQVLREVVGLRTPD